MLPGAFAFTIRAVAEQNRGGIRAAAGSVIPNIGPQPPGLRLALSGCQHRQRCVVGVEFAGRQNALCQRRQQWLDEPVGPAGDVRQRRALDVQALTGIDL